MVSTNRVVVYVIIARVLSLSFTLALVPPKLSSRRLVQEKPGWNQVFGLSRKFQTSGTEISECDTILKSESKDFPIGIINRARNTSPENEPNARDNSVQIYLRFSPLIGGPSFLPLHVEVILAPHAKKNHVISENNYGGKAAPQFHKFDFLPTNPTDPMTLLRLMTLRPVSGKVRHRVFCEKNFPYKNEITVENGNRLTLDNILTFRYQKGMGLTVSLPIGNVASQQQEVKHQSRGMHNSTTINEIIADAICFSDDYRLTCGKELRLMGGKNCVSFAVDLLMHLNSSHGVHFKL